MARKEPPKQPAGLQAVRLGPAKPGGGPKKGAK